MRAAFEARSDKGLTQDDLACTLAVDKALISRRLNGEDNLTLKTCSFMATAMRCRLVVSFQPYEDVAGRNYFPPAFQNEWSTAYSQAQTGVANLPIVASVQSGSD